MRLTAFDLPFVARFLPAGTRDAAIATLVHLHARGFGGLITWLGGQQPSADYDRASDEYGAILAALPSGLDVHLSVAPLQLGLDGDKDACAARIARIARAAAPAGAVVSLAMSSSRHTDATLALFASLRAEHANLAICLQANLARTRADLERLLPLTRDIRLCRGGFNRDGVRVSTAAGRRQFLDLARLLIGVAGAERARLVVATHDGPLIAGVRRLAADRSLAPAAVEFQMVYGVRISQARRLLAAGHRVRILVSYGPAARAWFLARLLRHPQNFRYLLGDRSSRTRFS